VLKELADLDNPMRTLIGDDPGDGGLLEPPPEPEPDGDTQPPMGNTTEPNLDDLAPSPAPPATSEPTGNSNAAGADPTRRRNLPSVMADPEPGHRRSRFDPDTGTVLYNDRHADYLMVKDDEPGALDYLATIVAKEYVVYNNPRSTSEDLAEEMVRMLVRVRRHLPRRR
jgi:hypothetical protein